MNEKERVEIDIKKLEESIDEIEDINLDKNEIQIIEKAKQYKTDSIYYLKKEDEFTSFGCITYAHGLLDALKLKYELI
ncbi:DUF357 domain-containing protein [Methanobrevibacter curvatus]|uniref:DUF357 domain-containing protein n=1 Tax=Methanobrevibacter curvatus TaxID=49547 RepID=A0A166B680_9EURY|nr:DUF357 domain-containing protein [Methanobrevibacter curvatus]KZX12914.1 hypothetical protein MBCUR_08030 [Methanobrevibacter curvatus]